MKLFDGHVLSPSELSRTLAAERERCTFLAFRDGCGELVIRTLHDSHEVVIGRSLDADVVIDWDPEVSRLHARLERSGQVWTLLDDGLSRNGTLVDGKRVVSRCRLTNGDSIVVGRTVLVFRAPADATVETAAAADTSALAALTAAERRTLVALCRPVLERGLGASPASNRAIAAELSLTIDGVKARIKGLFAKLEIEDLPHNHKRSELARRVIAAGLVSSRDIAQKRDSVALPGG